ncbi:hypothetical protein [Hymenobacter koreensis]|uniref:Uncharacterized protein n=1 Tax=Hymenobacter koreensis TaxID=1084523 RepID=A0ABP8IV05_9BACT
MMRFDWYVCGAALLLSAATARAQSGGSVGIGTTTPDAKAALDIRSTDKGLLVPRLTEAQRLAMGTGLPAGLLVFQTDGTQPGFWYFFNGQWLALPSGSGGPGDNLGNHTATQDLNLQGFALRMGGGSGQNLLIGQSAGAALTTGTENQFVGYLSGLQTSTGSQNHFTGYISGGLNTSGQQNYFSGYRTGARNTTGSFNTFVGHTSGFNNVGGEYNLFAGIGAGFSNTAGNNNVALGANAGVNLTTGTNNTFLGAGAGLGTTTQRNRAVALGYNAKVDASNALVLGGTGTDAVRVGIGTSTPRGLLDVDGSGDIYLADDPQNGTLQNIYLPGHVFLSPYNNSGVAFLQARRPDNSGTLALQLRSWNNGQPVEGLRITGPGRVGIGLTNPQQALDVAGRTQSSQGFVTPNDQRYAYATPRTQYLVVSPSAFNGPGWVSFANSTENSGALTAALRSGGGGQAQAQAQVQLPDGATVTGLQTWITDIDPDRDGYVQLLRYEVPKGAGEVMAETTRTTGSNSGQLQALADNTIVSPVIDNQRYQYVLSYIGAYDANQAINMLLYSTRITYTVGQVE